MLYTKTIGDRIFYGIVLIYILSVCVVIAYPLINIVSSSFSAPEMVMKNAVVFFPRRVTLIGYEKVLKHPDILNSYWNTIMYTVVGTIVNVFMTALGAFPLSRKDFFGRKFWMIMITFTIFFGGGLIPTYILINKLKLVDSFWVMILPGAIVTYNLIVMRTFLQNNVPMELQEAAQIDGCHDINIFIRIVIPLSVPVIAVMTLFYGVGHWNAFFNALIYLRSKSRFPLQIVLRQILIENITPAEMMDGSGAETQIVSNTMKYSLIVIANLPILMVYPYIQKYFVRGVMIGSLKE